MSVRWAIFDGRGERYGSYRWRWVARVRRLALDPRRLFTHIWSTNRPS